MKKIEVAEKSTIEQVTIIADVNMSGLNMSVDQGHVFRSQWKDFIKEHFKIKFHNV